MKNPIAELYGAHHRAMCIRHAEALTVTGYDWLIVYSGKPHPQFLDDSLCPFRANPHFKCWVPLADHPGGAVIVGKDGSTRLLYLQPEDYWHAPPADPEGYWADRFDLTTARDDQAVIAAAAGLSGHVAVICDDTAPAELRRLGDNNPAALLNLLHYERAAKTDYEVECMRRANAIALRGHAVAEQAFRAGASEFEIHVEYCRACGQTPNELPYDNIIALNGHGAVLHYHGYEHERSEPLAFLIDAGASYNGYAADITRTYSAADDDFAAFIDSVDVAQRALCNLAQPGVDYVDLHLDANNRLATVLCEHGIVDCSAEAAVEQGIVSAFFPHGLGHYIGAQVHDVGGHQATPGGGLRPPPEDHPFLRLTRTLAPGTVCTIEPGLYFIDMLLQRLKQTDAGRDVAWQRVEAFMPYGGVRIEDDMHITASGNENLTRGATTPDV